METHFNRRFRSLFALITVAVLAVPSVALGAGPAFSNSGTHNSSPHGRSSFSHRFDGLGFGVDGLEDEQSIIIQQSAIPPTSPHAKPPQTRIYVPPRWVDGGYGVQVLQPSYWIDSNPAAEH